MKSVLAHSDVAAASEAYMPVIGGGAELTAHLTQNLCDATSNSPGVGIAGLNALYSHTLERGQSGLTLIEREEPIRLEKLGSGDM